MISFNLFPLLDRIQSFQKGTELPRLRGKDISAPRTASCDPLPHHPTSSSKDIIFGAEERIERWKGDASVSAFAK